MTIKTNKKIQKAVDARQGHRITHIAALHACAVKYADEEVETSSVAIDAFADGVKQGLKLAQDFTHALSRTKTDAPYWNQFGIYVATQETSDGDDRLYFIGTPSQILEKLEKVPATELVSN